MTNKLEMETIVRFDRSGEECIIYTADKAMMRKLGRRYQQVSETTSGGKVTGREYKTKKKYISFRADPGYQPGEFAKRKMSPAQLTNLSPAKKKGGKQLVNMT